MTPEMSLADRPGWRFHHLGLACRDLEREAAALSVLGYRPTGSIIEDPGLGVRVWFFEGGGPRIELVAQLDGTQGADASNVLEGWLARGAKIYHAAYEVEDFDESVSSRLDRQAKVTVRPTPAVAFDGRQVAFLMLRNGYLVELIEAPTQSSTHRSR